MRTLSVLCLLTALAIGQAPTTLTGSAHVYLPSGTQTTQNVSISFNLNGNNSAAAIITVNGQSCALNLRRSNVASGNGMTYYSGKIECNGVKYHVSLLIGHPEGPIAGVDWSFTNSQGYLSGSGYMT